MAKTLFPTITLNYYRLSTCRVIVNSIFDQMFHPKTLRFSLNKDWEYELVINSTGNKVLNRNCTWSFESNIEAIEMQGVYRVERINDYKFKLIKDEDI